MTIEINVLRGSRTIGGNKILVTFDGRIVLFDFGYDYSVDKLFFDSYTRTRQNRGLHDHLDFDMLPRLGIYRKDLITTDCTEDCAAFPRLNIDALLISHAHMDHIGMAGFLDIGIPFVASPLTIALMKAIEDMDDKIGTEVAYINERECPGGYLLKSPGRGAPYLGRKLVTTSRSEGLEELLGRSPTKTRSIARGECANPDSLAFETRRFDVDHSIYGASAFGVNTSEGWVIYTGDLRDHGVNGERTASFAEEARKLSPRVLIIEGTRASRQEEVGGLTESQVERNCLEECKGAEGLIVADFGPRNFERLEAFGRIAKEIGRELVITPKDAYFLDSMRMADGADRLTGIRVIESNKESRNSMEVRIMDELGDSKVTPTGVRLSPDSYILCYSFYDLPHLLDVKPNGGLYLYSGSGSFDEEQDHDFGRLDNWIRKFGMRKVGFDMVERKSHRGDSIMVPEFTPGYHASGHASKDVLRKLVERIRPEYLIPVHTENPDFFSESVSCVSPEKILLPVDGMVQRIG